MRRAWLMLFLLALAAGPVRAQYGKTIVVEAGTPEDKALSAIYAAGDPAQKIALLDAFVAQYGKGDMALLADELYVEACLAQKNYARAYEHGDRALQLDPDNAAVAAELARAAQEQGDLEKEFTYGERLGAILARVAAAPPPAGMTPADWQSEKANAREKIRGDVDYTEQLLYSSAANAQPPGQKAAFLERFVAAFPDSRDAANAEWMVAETYQQSGQTAKMLDFARKRLAANPNDMAMDLLLADFLSQSGKNLPEAEAAAKKTLDLLSAAKKPQGVADADWNKQVSVQKGLAYSALGQVYVTQTRNAAAVEAFTAAAPLLQGNPVNYARNQYRLGFTLAKMRRFAEARKALGQAVALDTPYKKLALDELAKLPGGQTTRRH